MAGQRARGIGQGEMKNALLSFALACLLLFVETVIGLLIYAVVMESQWVFAAPLTLLFGGIWVGIYGVIEGLEKQAG